MRCPRCGKSVRLRRDGEPYFHRKSDGRTCKPKALLSQADHAEKAEAERDEARAWAYWLRIHMGPAQLTSALASGSTAPGRPQGLPPDWLHKEQPHPFGLAAASRGEGQP